MPEICREILDSLVDLAVKDWESFSDVMKVYLIEDFNYFYNLTYLDFRLFTFTIFAWSVKQHDNVWNSGQFVADACDHLQNNKKTMDIAGRGHFKSTRFYSYISWIIWKNLYDKLNDRVYYYSYKTTQARQHVNLFKRFLQNNETFQQLGIQDKKSAADTIAEYSWDGKHSIYIQAFGILESTRGLHSRYLFCDDPYKDDSDPNRPTKVLEVNRLFKDVLENIPFPDGGEIHVIGTPISTFDIWFTEGAKKTYSIQFKPAIVLGKDGEEKAVWPERFSLEWLKEKRDTGFIETPDGNLFSFAQEYLCEPRSVHNSFFNKQKLEKSIDHNLMDWNMSDPRFVNEHEYFKPDVIYPVYAGFDLGEKAHPSHLAVFQYEPEHDKLVQIHSKWFDKVRYLSEDKNENTQIKYLKDAIKYFNIQKIIFDNTRGEFQLLLEQNIIPELVPISFNRSNKMSMLVEMDNRLGTEKLKLLPEERQKSQILALQHDGSAISSSQGHADAAFSIALVCLHVAKFRKAQSQTFKISSVDIINRSKFKPSMIKPIGTLKRDFKNTRKKL